jgi:hypothetical protein
MTESGKRLLDPREWPNSRIQREWVATQVPAIEAEAVTAALTALRARMLAVLLVPEWIYDVQTGGMLDPRRTGAELAVAMRMIEVRAAVLAAIDEATPKEKP